jgi:hypothetical protein
MTQLKDKIQNAMDESRTLVLDAEILIGFDFTATFQDGFERLSRISQAFSFIGLILMLVTLVLLISPAPFDQFTENGRDSANLHHFTTQVVERALGPFALALGTSVYVAAEDIGGRLAGGILGLATSLLAILLWYGHMLLKPRRKDRGEGAFHAIVGKRSGCRSKSRARQDPSSAHGSENDYSRQPGTFGFSVCDHIEARLPRSGALAKVGTSLELDVDSGEHLIAVNSRSVSSYR